MPENRFGKTISVSMFAAALMFSCAGCEVSIYSTCKRISTKLLRNVTMFLGIIYDVLKCEHLKIIRANQEEVHLQGDEGYRDVRIIQSYPSKVGFSCDHMCVSVSVFKLAIKAWNLNPFKVSFFLDTCAYILLVTKNTQSNGLHMLFS